jgi:cell wall-associated NlpC family hydrolase
MSAACASTGAVPRPFPSPRGTPPSAGQPSVGRPEPAAATGPVVAAAALTLRNRPYRAGGSDPAGFDCSGFTQYVFAQQGVALPREVRDQFRMGKSIKPHDVAPGDLLFFRTTSRRVSHVAIALGGDEFVHAPSSNGVVRVERLDAAYWSRRFVGARRVV